MGVTGSPGLPESTARLRSVTSLGSVGCAFIHSLWWFSPAYCTSLLQVQNVELSRGMQSGVRRPRTRTTLELRHGELSYRDGALLNGPRISGTECTAKFSRQRRPAKVVLFGYRFALPQRRPQDQMAIGTWRPARAALARSMASRETAFSNDRNPAKVKPCFAASRWVSTT